MKPSIYKAALAEFLRDHPEHKAGCCEHPRLGTAFSTEAAYAFGEWSVRKGYSTQEQFDTMKAAMKLSLENKAPESES